MDYFLTEEQSTIKDLARTIFTEHVLPVKEELDREAMFPREILKPIAEAGITNVFIPKEYGGEGKGIFEFCLIAEQLSKIEAGVALTFLSNTSGSLAIALAGSEAQKKKYLLRIASGEHLCASAMIEPQAGRDVVKIKTAAKRVGNEYVIDGVKQWVVNGGEAQLYIVLTITNNEKGARGLTTFIVEKGTPGLSFGANKEKMGIRSAAACELRFENCKVGPENMLGKEGDGFEIFKRTFNRSQVSMGAIAVGIAQGAFEHALKYSQERRQFGATIGSFEAIGSMLADMAAQIESARSLVYNVARMLDAGIDNCEKESAMSKLIASDVAMKVATDAVQIYGGYGYMRDFPVEKYMRDAKMTQIYAGANEHQRATIGEILAEEAKQSMET